MVKVISLSNEAYERLKSIKRDKSFSEVVVSLINESKIKNKDVMKFAGAFKDKKKWDDVKKIIEEDRKNARMREVKF
jgi:predicted CopG family antitoxin